MNYFPKVLQVNVNFIQLTEIQLRDIFNFFISQS
jgi:hypothetical protein